MINTNSVTNNVMQIKFRLETFVDFYCICKIEISTFQNFQMNNKIMESIVRSLKWNKKVICNEEIWLQKYSEI